MATPAAGIAPGTLGTHAHAEDGSQASFEVFFSLSGAAMTFADDDGGLRVSQFEDEDGYSALCICLP